MNKWIDRWADGWIDEQTDATVRRQLPLDCYGAQATYFSCLMESMVL